MKPDHIDQTLAAINRLEDRIKNGGDDGTRRIALWVNLLSIAAFAGIGLLVWLALT